MKKYVVIYHASADALAKSMETPPEEAKEGMEQWYKWAKDCGEHMVDMGMPLAYGQKINVDGSAHPSDRQVCGYSILQADTLEEAKGLLKGHPHLSGWDNSCEIEVHETLPLPG